MLQIFEERAKNYRFVCMFFQTPCRKRDRTWL